MTWTPTTPELFQEKDTATGLDYLCSYTEVGAEIVAYQWTLTPEPPPGYFLVSSSLDGVRVVVPMLSGLFPIQFIDYRDGDDIKRVLSWDELPPGKDLVEFRPSGNPKQVYTLTVSVDYLLTDELTGLETEMTDANSWECIVLHDYSGGRGKLLEYMNHASS